MHHFRFTNNKLDGRDAILRELIGEITQEGIYEAAQLLNCFGPGGKSIVQLGWACTVFSGLVDPGITLVPK
jgi:hypothetical protein